MTSRNLSYLSFARERERERERYQRHGTFCFLGDLLHHEEQQIAYESSANNCVQSSNPIDCWAAVSLRGHSVQFHHSLPRAVCAFPRAWEWWASLSLASNEGGDQRQTWLWNNLQLLTKTHHKRNVTRTFTWTSKVEHQQSQVAVPKSNPLLTFQSRTIILDAWNTELKETL